MTTKLIPLSKATNLRLVGGKARALSRLLQGGFNVPNGFVVTTDTDIENPEFTQELLTALDKLEVRYIAVRSSAVAEDSSKATWAGQFDTFLNVDKKTLLTAVRKCRYSRNSIRAKAYAKHTKSSSGQIAVIVQAMVQSEVSGVAFSSNPIAKGLNQLVIEAGLGLGEAIVSGQITPDTYIVRKEAPRTIKKNISRQSKKLVQASGGNEWIPTGAIGNQQKLSEFRINQLTKIILKLEEFWGFPVDIEWAFYKDQFYITQSRPITALS